MRLLSPSLRRSRAGAISTRSARIIRMALVDTYRHERAERRGGDRDRIPTHDELCGWTPVVQTSWDSTRALQELGGWTRARRTREPAFRAGVHIGQAADISGLSRRRSIARSGWRAPGL